MKMFKISEFNAVYTFYTCSYADFYMSFYIFQRYQYLAEWELYLCFDQLSFQLPYTHIPTRITIPLLPVCNLYIELVIVLINWFYGASFM